MVGSEFCSIRCINLFFESEIKIVDIEPDDKVSLLKNIQLSEKIEFLVNIGCSIKTQMHQSGLAIFLEIRGFTFIGRNKRMIDIVNYVIEEMCLYPELQKFVSFRSSSKSDFQDSRIIKLVKNKD